MCKTNRLASIPLLVLARGIHRRIAALTWTPVLPTVGIAIARSVANANLARLTLSLALGSRVVASPTLLIKLLSMTRMIFRWEVSRPSVELPTPLLPSRTVMSTSGSMPEVMSKKSNGVVPMIRALGPRAAT